MNSQDNGDANLSLLSSERLASLSDGMFGVAMTLLATTLIGPIQSMTGSAFKMVHDVGAPLSNVALSFGISAVYWVAQQRQLVMTRSVTAIQALLHFIFLFFIVLLPISTALLGRGPTTRAVVVVYGSHLALLGLMNLLVWMATPRTTAGQAGLVGSCLTLAALIAALAVGTVRPGLAQYFWYASFFLSWIGRRVTRMKLEK